LIEVTFIIPYDEIQDEVISLINEVKEEGVIFKTVKVIGTHEAIRDYGSDIIVARGVTYLTLKKNFKDKSIIEIEVTAYDVIRAIGECKKKFNAKKIAIIGSETMIYGTESLEGIMGVCIEVFKIEDEEDVVRALDIAAMHGIDAIVGGLTAYSLAKDRGWNCLWIRTGKEAIRQAIKEALNTARTVMMERTKAELFKIILEHTKEALIAVDRDGKINTLNKPAYKNLKIAYDRNLTGQPIHNYINDEKLLSNIRSGEKELDVIGTINETMVAYSCIPIKVGTSSEGALVSFENVNKIQEMESKIRRELSQKGLVAKYSFGNIIGKSSELTKTIQIAYKYSQVDSNILLCGETGTGKELFAQSIHNTSSRKLEPFVAVNCAALPENLLESELFGYVDGAFSGASKGGKSGLFELAHRGTLFLDEVEELPFNLQAKLLRVLQEKEIRRIGDDRVIPVDVRIIAATNVDLKEKIMNNKFRQDLLFRLNILNLKIPPLSERKGDVEYIACYFIEMYCKKFSKSIPKLTLEAVKVLNSYNWPGNIRELRNICERIAVLVEGDIIDKDDIISFLDANEEYGEKNPNAFNNTGKEAEDINKLIEAAKFNKAEMARLMGISRTTLWRRLNKKS
jgi:transcriptional regulator, propionate catabolism operon regulatory protein